MSLQIINDKSSDVVTLEIVTKLSMCRICLVENVRMHVIADKCLQELYEKLTDIPLVTEDSRPMLACFLCYAKLKQCCQLQRKCLQAEELFAQMLNEDYELYPSIYRSQLQLFGEFIKTPIQNITIVDDCQVEKDAMKADVPPVKNEAELIHHKEEPLSDGSYKQNDSYQELEDLPPQHSESNTEDDLPLIVMKFEEEEEQPAAQTTRSTVVEKPKLDTWNAKIEDTMNTKQQEKRLAESNSTQNVNQQSRARSDKGEKPYKCEICQRSFVIKRCLDSHIRFHTNKKPFKCGICQCSLISRQVLEAHIKAHDEKPYKCEICQRSFIKKRSLDSHVRFHTSEKPFKCDICQCSFISMQVLKAHIIEHDEKPFKCDMCQSYFVVSSALKRHIRIQTGEKPCKCNICQQCFTSQSYLRTHSRMHNGEKPYICEICHRSFVKKRSLESHIRFHTNKETFKCDT